MREILFRAKRVDNGEWIEGNVLQCDDGDCYIATSCLVGASDEPLMVAAYKVDPETLCLFTGLTDKNGKRIWENDIVSCEHEKYPEDNPLEVLPFSDPIKYKRNYSVEFINTGSSYGYRLRNKSIHFMLTGNVVYNHKIEVIGNIFDDKHLLSETDYYREQEKETEDKAWKIENSIYGRKDIPPLEIVLALYI